MPSLFRKETKSKALHNKIDKSFISIEQVLLIGQSSFCPNSMLKKDKITNCLLLDVKWLPFHWF